MITYPTDLPLPPPPDRWNGDLLGPLNDTTDADEYRRVDMVTEVDAPDADTAERRALAIHVYDYDDEVRVGETATATDLGNGRWSVVLHWEFYDT